MPSQMTNSDASGPARYSSITTSPHAAAWARAASRSAVTTTPLPAARPSALTTYGGPNSVERRLGSRHIEADPGPGGRHARSRHDLLGKRLRPLQPGGVRGRSEADDALGSDRVGDAGDERRLRADDDQVDVQLSSRER